MSENTTLLRNPVDTWTGEDHPTANHADTKALWLRSGENHAWVFFNRPFPLGATIVEATLRLYTMGNWNATETVSVRRAMERWGVNRITWNNAPNVGDLTASLTRSSSGDEDEWAIDVTEHMQRVSNGGVWYGFRIATDATVLRKFHSGNTAVGTRPQLEVTWSQAPQAPDTLTPSGGLAVSIAKPFLRFDFTDHRGSTALQAVHVQIDSDGTFAAPEWDSGTVLAAEPELDLAATTYPGLSAGDTTRWRVRVQDGAGLWSEWSDPATFRRDNKGSLTIDNPGAAPNDFVSEWTPPIIWSLTGETQRAWQLLITPADDPTDHLYDTGRTKGTDNSWTLPKGVLEDDSRYRVVVRIWDTKDRVHTSSADRVYTQAVREFVFREDPTTNPPTALTASNLLPRPWVELEWQRGTAPDRFVVKRNGRVIEADVDPADALVSGTTYRWRDKDAHPYRRHTWVVQAVANGKTSGNNPSVTMRVVQQGIWLADHERDLDVFINGKDDGSWAMGEEATTHHPLGALHGVRITQAMRGLEGNITGTLTDNAGKTVEEWEDRLLRIKARAGQVCTLSLGNTSMRVVVGNVAVWPTSTQPITKGVSFDFWQVGRLDFKPRL
jgi:hypothetical protein